jgi:hypothetical protein
MVSPMSTKTHHPTIEIVLEVGWFEIPSCILLGMYNSHLVNPCSLYMQGFTHMAFLDPGFLLLVYKVNQISKFRHSRLSVGGYCSQDVASVNTRFSLANSSVKSMHIRKYI